MSLHGYVKKHKPANWTAAFPPPSQPAKKQKRPKVKDDPEYRAQARAYLELLDTCPKCGGKATDVHHTRGRNPRALKLAERWWLPLCRDCHNWAHDNIALARTVWLASIPGAEPKPLIAQAGDWGRLE